MIHRLALLVLFAASVCAAQVSDTKALMLAALVDAEPWSVLPTHSMEPMFNETYILLVKRIPFAQLIVSDVILYHSGNLIELNGIQTDVVSHQVWARSSGGSVLIAKGLANARPDAVLITEDMYVGVVVGQFRRRFLLDNSPHSAYLTLR